MVIERRIVRDAYDRYYFKNGEFHAEFKSFCIRKNVWLHRYMPISFNGFTQYNITDEAFQETAREYAHRVGVRIRCLKKKLELKKNPQQLVWYFLDEKEKNQTTSK